MVRDDLRPDEARLDEGGAVPQGWGAEAGGAQGATTGTVSGSRFQGFDPGDEIPPSRSEAFPPGAGRGRDARSGPSIPALLRGIIDDLRTLLRQEVRLAGAEVSEKASTAGRNAASIGAGGAVAFAGLLFLLGAATAGLYIGLAEVMEPAHAMWLAPLIVGAAVAIVGYAMVQKGITTLKRMRLTPERTKESLKETGRTVRRAVSEEPAHAGRY